jgi:hypothetical protein
MFPKCPVLPCRYGYLKPCSFPGNTNLPDGQPGDREDLPCQKESDTGMLPVPVIKNIPLLFCRNTDPVIFTGYDQGMFKL